jgi:hypothetical protein
MVTVSKHLELLSLVCCCIYQEPSNRPIKLKPAQAIANEAVKIGYKICTSNNKQIQYVKSFSLYIYIFIYLVQRLNYLIAK